MKKYKGYLIDHYSFAETDREWDGHSSRSYETGRIISAYKIVDLESLKTLHGFDSEPEAQTYIDFLTDERNQLAFEEIRKQIAELEAQEQKLRKAYQDAKEAFEDDLRFVRVQQQELNAKLPREFY